MERQSEPINAHSRGPRNVTGIALEFNSDRNKFGKENTHSCPRHNNKLCLHLLDTNAMVSAVPNDQIIPFCPEGTSVVSPSGVFAIAFEFPCSFDIVLCQIAECKLQARVTYWFDVPVLDVLDITDECAVQVGAVLPRGYIISSWCLIILLL